MSSLIFLGFSIIAFIVSYGIMFTVAPMILGAFFEAADNMPIADPEWAVIYETNEDTVQFLVPLIPAVGIFVLVIKVLMVASVRGRD
jgi:hypothetical protein